MKSLNFQDLFVFTSPSQDILSRYGEDEEETNISSVYPTPLIMSQ